MSEDQESKKSRLPAILLGVAIVLAVIVAILHAVPCIPIPVPGISAGADPAVPVMEPKKAMDPPVQPMDPTTGGLSIDKPDLGIISPSPVK